MKRQITFSLAATACLALVRVQVRAADPWADEVVSYMPGTGIGNDFTNNDPFNNPLVALGEPTRFSTSLPYTAPFEYGGVLTPQQSAFRATELVTIGNGGWLVVKFNEPVTNDPLNPYGIDLLVFGNSFLKASPAGVIEGFDHEGGHLEVSADGMTYVDVVGEVDGLFPTNAYVDVTDPYSQTPGAVPSDYTLPMNPAFNPVGKTYADVLAAYGHSGGGFGVDIGPSGLSSISYVRFTAPFSTGPLPEIDALADVRAVPEPAESALITLALILLGKNARARTL